MSLQASAAGRDYETAMLIQSLMTEVATLKALIVSAVKNGKIVVDHTELSTIGTNTHAQIDSHIANTSLHFTAASVIVVQNAAPALSDTAPNFWFDDTSNPWKGYARLKNGSGTYQWVQFTKGNP